MAVFYDTGGGDIYAGPTREAVLAAMLEDSEEIVEADIVEVSGTMKIRVQNENEDPTDELVTLEEEYCESLGSYCIASENY